MKKCGIYKILNLINNKIYIGQSVDICYRWKQHKKSNSKNKYHNIYLDRAIHKYGIENFKFEIIELCKRENLNGKEKYWIKYYDSTNRSCGYNISLGGYSEPLSDEHKIKIKNGLLEHYKKHKYTGNLLGEKNPFYGKTHTKEVKEKIRKFHIGKFASQETKEKMRNSAKGHEPRNNKLTKEDVLEIIDLLNKNIKQKEIAEKYNIHPSTVSDIKTGRRWNNLIKNTYNQTS